MKKIIFIMSIAAIVTACSNDNDWDATGTFEATEVVVSAKGSGEIKSLNIEEGQEVEANTQLGYLDMTQLEIQKAQFDANQLNLDATKAGLDANKAQLDANKQQMSETKANMNSSKKQIDATQNSNDSRILDIERQVASIKQQIANLKKEKARFTAMLKDNAASQKQVDDINYQILVLEKQLGASQDQLSSTNRGLSNQSQGYSAQKEGVDAQMRGVDAQMRGVDAQKRGIDAQKRGIDAQKQGIDAQKALVDNQMQNSIIMSPVKGTILTKYAQCGEFATTGKPLFKVADMSTVYLRAYFTSDQLADIKLGQQVKVIADFGAGKTREYTGKISWISSESEFTPKSIQTKDTRANMVYAVKIAVKNDGYLKLGLSGNVILK